MTAPTPEPTPTPAPSPAPTPAPAPPPEPAPSQSFPANTPVEQMTSDQKVAYWQHQSRKHEARATEWQTAAGGKTAAEVAADLKAAEEVRLAAQTEHEKAVEAAKTAGKTEGASEWQTKAVKAAFDIALAGMDDAARAEELGVLDLSKFVSESGEVDTAKVRSHAERLVPGKGGDGKTPVFDFGAGKRGDGGQKTGVAAGADLFESRRKKTTTASS